MTVTVYSSTDASAPVLSNNVGTMINVLDACLVNGYGSKAAAGWTKPFSGTNTAVYRMGGGNQRYLNVIDTVANTATVRGYETMTGVGVGTGPFPLEGVTTYPNGVFWGKSSAVAGIAVSWVIVATDKAFYFWNNYANQLPGSTFSGAHLQFFGDFTSYRSVDVYNTLLIGDDSVAPSTANMSFLISTLSTAAAGHYIARGFHQGGGAVNVGKHSDYLRANTQMGVGSLTYPNPIDGALVLAPIWIHEPNNTQYPIRGTLPGMMAICHTRPAANGDTVGGNGSGELSGKTYQIFNFVASTYSQAAVEISNTW